jgi:hypothetical protein
VKNSSQRVSLFRKGTPAEPKGTIPIKGLFEEIRDGAHKANVIRVRDAVNQGKPKDMINDLKREIPSVTISGEITQGGRAQAMTEKRFTHSGLLQIDMDEKDNQGRNPEEIRDILASDPHTLCAFLSPSGTGTKAVMMIPVCKDEADHKAAFESAAMHYRNNYNLQIDGSTKDPVRLCYLSWDENAKWNDHAEPITVTLPVIPEEIRPEEKALEEKPVTSHKLEELAAMLAVMPSRNDYNDWLRVCSGAWNEYGEAATPILAEKWPEEKQGEYSEKFKNRLQHCTLGTVIHHAKQCGWKKESQGEPARFEYVHADDLQDTEGAFDFVEDLLTEGAASVIYGASNSGKTFFALDLAAHVATGRDWMEKECEQGAVIYIALEGKHGATNRIKAMNKTGKLPKGSPLFVCFSPVDLIDKKHPEGIKRMIEEITETTTIPVRLVIIDTLARAMAGGDENSGKDMSEAVKSIDIVRNGTGAHVCIIHHSGKDTARGARGHSSLRAAIDTEIEVIHPEGDKYRTATIVKQRDIAPCPPICFSLEVVELGTNRRLRKITSCVVKEEDSIMANTKGKAGRKQQYTCEMILALLPQNNVKEWEKAAKDTHTMSHDTFHDRKRECASLWHRVGNQIALKPLENQEKWGNGEIKF